MNQAVEHDAAKGDGRHLVGIRKELFVAVAAGDPGRRDNGIGRLRPASGPELRNGKREQVPAERNDGRPGA